MGEPPGGRLRADSMGEPPGGRLNKLHTYNEFPHITNFSARRPPILRYNWTPLYRSAAMLERHAGRLHMIPIIVKNMQLLRILLFIMFISFLINKCT